MTAATTSTKTKPRRKAKPRPATRRKKKKPAAKRPARRKGPAIPAKWRKLLLRVPGYDPIATAPPGYTFDPAAAEHALDFFPECLTHVKGEWAGRPLKLRPWQQAIIANIFGWKRPDGSRRFREAFIFIPRKNGKTTLCAGIVNYMLFADGEPGAEIYSAAGEREQAAIIYGIAKQMVEAEPELAKRAKIYTAAKCIYRAGTASSYKAISAESKTKHGYNTHCAVIDELHVQPNRHLVDVLETSTGARRQPLIVHITTAGYDRHSICFEKYDYACKVRDGIIDDPHTLPVIYEVGKDDDWTGEAVWKKANPNFGLSPKTDYFRGKFAKAVTSPATENTFRRLHLNQWTEQDVRWLNMEKWDACGGIVDAGQLAGELCYAGLDLSSTTDITALVLLFPPTEDRPYYVLLPFFWIPEDNAREREDRDRVPYTQWIRDGLIYATEGNVVDQDAIRLKLGELNERYNIHEIAADRWEATKLITELQGDGFDVVAFGMGFASMAAPTKEFNRLILAEQIAHGDNPVLRWMASNVAVKQDPAGNLKPDKAKSTERIDGIVAAIMALGRASVDAGDEASIYETEPLKVLG